MKKLNFDISEKKALEYDLWFDENLEVFKSELIAIKKLLPKGNGLEIGVGTGRFASELDIKEGLEPSLEMGKLAKSRGIKITVGTAERLPFKNEKFDFVLMVTLFCFLDRPMEGLAEALRVVRPGGKIIIANIDGDSKLGKIYKKKKSVFYRNANFTSAVDQRKIMEKAGLKSLKEVQTLFGDLAKIKIPQTPKTGFGKGGFVVICGTKPKSKIS
jgi:ubiquinone/menaquinone biosynthesis C-methylase UbiE